MTVWRSAKPVASGSSRLRFGRTGLQTNFRVCNSSAYFQAPLGIEEAVKLDEFGHESCPAGLVTGAQPGTIVAMEVFVEVDVVAPERIVLELFRAAIDGSSAIRVAQENPGEPVGDFPADFEEVHEVAGAGGAFDFEVVAVI